MLKYVNRKGKQKMKKAVAVITLAATMSLSLVGCGSKAPEYVDGDYEGTAAGGMSDITVSVSVVDGKIAAVDMVSHEETPGIADAAFEQVPAAIVEKNSTEVDIVAGATGTSDGIMQAVENALEGQTE